MKQREGDYSYKGYRNYVTDPPETKIMAECINAGCSWAGEIGPDGGGGQKPDWWRPLKTVDELWIDLVELKNSKIEIFFGGGESSSANDLS